MTGPLRLLIVEDAAEDAEIAVAELRRAGFAVSWRRVETEADLAAALDAECPDVILSDYSMPAFSGLQALRLVRERAPLVPFIVCTGSINEETAVACMKAGAWDYVLKDRLSRLPSAVSAAVDLARTREERARALAELRKGEERYRGLVETSFDWIWEIDAEGRYTYCSPRVSELLGYAPAEVLGRTPFELMPEGEAARVGGIFAGLAAEARPFACIENVNLHKDGRLVVLETSGVPVLGPGGELRGYRGTDRDVTERRRGEERRRRLEEQLAQAQKMEAIGRLAGGVAHDFNNILQALMGLTSVLRVRTGMGGAAGEAVDEIDNLVRRGAALTRQLLLFSRREPAAREPVDLNWAVRDAAAMLRRVVRENVAIECNLTDVPLTVLADPGQLGQVLMNLAVNASDAMPEGGRIALSTGVGGESVWLRVADTGMGIPETVQAKIFDPFFTTKAAGKGTGLGLSVVHGIITDHGGRVEVASRPGEGAVFTVSLPRGSIDSVPVPASPAAGAAPDLMKRGSGERILVVEDEDGARSALVAILEVLGFAVAAAATGEEALGLADEPAFDLLLTDLMLPGVAGPELAGELRRRWPRLRVILMSGYTEEEASRLSAAGVAECFLQKPFDAATLSTAVAAALA